MTLSFGVFTFLNVWWVMLFFVLPFYFRKNEQPSSLEYAAAPQTPKWKRVMWVNTALSLAVTLLIALVIKSGIFAIGDIS